MELGTFKNGWSLDRAIVAPLVELNFAILTVPVAVVPDGIEAGTVNCRKRESAIRKVVVSDSWPTFAVIVNSPGGVSARIEHVKVVLSLLIGTATSEVTATSGELDVRYTG